MRKQMFLGVIAISFTLLSCQQKQVQSEEKELVKGEVSKALADLKLAADLSKYGYANEAPLALIQAAEIMAKYDLKDLDAKLVEEGAKNESTDEKKGKVEVDKTKLLADAKALAGENKVLTQFIEDVEQNTRGAVYGAARVTRSVDARSYGVYTVAFVAGELARIACIGDGDTDLDLYVSDSNGNLIEKDDDYTDDCFVQWVPKWTGNYTIKVVNRGAVHNNFILATN